jgi:uncharacterized protein (DUF433 family)
MATRSTSIGVRGALSAREVALLSKASVPTVKKALQQHKLKVRRSGGHVVMEPRAVLAMAAYRQLDVRLSAAAQRRVRDALFAPGDDLPEQIEISDALVLRLTDEMRESFQRALEYIAARDAHIERRADVLGGTPVIKGTRLSVYALAARVDGGEALGDLEADYPDVPVEALRAALDFARTHPPAGRPRKPWRATAA